MNAIISTSKDYFPRPEPVKMLNTPWGLETSMQPKLAYHLLSKPVCPHLCSRPVNGTATQSKLRRHPRLHALWVLWLLGHGEPANFIMCLESSEAPTAPQLPRGLPTLPSNLASWATWWPASSQRAVITDALLSASITHSFQECRICPLHEAVPARQKFAEWSKLETKEKEVLCTHCLGRVLQRQLQRRAGAVGGHHVLPKTVKKGRRLRSARSEYERQCVCECMCVCLWGGLVKTSRSLF